MRLLKPCLVAAALLAAPAAGFAQQSPYDYPWCAVYTNGNGPGGAMSCYYTSHAQCMRTMSGIGGICVQSPYYRGPGPREPRRRREY